MSRMIFRIVYPWLRYTDDKHPAVNGTCRPLKVNFLLLMPTMVKFRSTGATAMTPLCNPSKGRPASSADLM